MGSLADAIFSLLKPSDYNRHPGMRFKLRIYPAGHTGSAHAVGIQFIRLEDLPLIFRGLGAKAFKLIKIPSHFRLGILCYVIAYFLLSGFSFQSPDDQN